jgi:hypothetical protein
MGLANRQDVVVGLLARELLLDAIDPDGNGLLDTPDEISSAAAHLARWRQGDTEIDRLATGAFRPAAERLVATPEIGDLQDAIDESIRTGQVRVLSDDNFVQALAGDHDAPYATFRRDVAVVLADGADQADQRAADATADRNRAVLVMVAALALAVVVAAVTVAPAITAAGRSRRPRSTSWSDRLADGARRQLRPRSVSVAVWLSSSSMAGSRTRAWSSASVSMSFAPRVRTGVRSTPSYGR